MEKNEIFTFTAPNGVEVTAVVLYPFICWTDESNFIAMYTCYAQNKLFSYFEDGYCDFEDNIEKEEFWNPKFGEVIVEYCVMPELDKLLARYNDIEVTKAETADGM